MDDDLGLDPVDAVTAAAIGGAASKSTVWQFIAFIIIGLTLWGVYASQQNAESDGAPLPLGPIGGLAAARRSPMLRATSHKPSPMHRPASMT